jgi:hypothetical protein
MAWGNTQLKHRLSGAFVEGLALRDIRHHGISATGQRRGSPGRWRWAPRWQWWRWASWRELGWRILCRPAGRLRFTVLRALLRTAAGRFRHSIWPEHQYSVNL